MKRNKSTIGEQNSPISNNSLADGSGLQYPADSMQASAISGVSRGHDCEHGEVELDTSPTNRVSNKYNPEYFKALRWGIDNLYCCRSKVPQA